jgi:hypothetical protein
MLRRDVQDWKDLAQRVDRGQPNRRSPSSRWETFSRVAKNRLDLVINIENPNLGSGTWRSTRRGSPAAEGNIAHGTSAVWVYAHQLAAPRETSAKWGVAETAMPSANWRLAKYWGDSGGTPADKDGEIRVRMGKLSNPPWVGRPRTPGSSEACLAPTAGSR